MKPLGVAYNRLSPEVELLRLGYMRGKGKLRLFVSTWNPDVHNVPKNEEA